MNLNDLLKLMLLFGITLCSIQALAVDRNVFISVKDYGEYVEINQITIDGRYEGLFCRGDIYKGDNKEDDTKIISLKNRHYAQLNNLDCKKFQLYRGAEQDVGFYIEYDNQYGTKDLIAFHGYYYVDTLNLSGVLVSYTKYGKLPLEIRLGEIPINEHPIKTTIAK